MNRLGIRQTLLVVGAALALALGLFAMVSLEDTDWRAWDVQKEHLDLAKLLARYADRELEDMIGELVALADSLPIDGPLDSVPRDYLEVAHRSMRNEAVRVRTLFLASPSGALFQATADDPELAVQLLNDRVPAVAEQNVEVTQGFPGQEESLYPHLRLTQPVRAENGALLAILGAHVDVDWMDDLVPPFRLGRTGTVALVDRRGRPMASSVASDAPSVFPPRELLPLLRRAPAVGRVQASSSDSGEVQTGTYLVASVPLDNAPLAVVVGQAEDEALSEVYSLRNRLTLLLGFVAVLFAFACWIASRNVLCPVAALIRACERIAAGELDVLVPRAAGGEIGRLARAFATMQANLQDSRAELAGWNRTLGTQVRVRTGQLLEAQRNLIAEQQRARALSTRYFNSQEDERQRIALEIHDSIIQSLAGARYRFQSIEADGRIDPALARQMQDVSDLLGETIRDLRRILSDLRPMALTTATLVPATRQYLERFEQQHLLVCHLTVSGTPVALTNAVEVATYRIIQEALNNVQRHANASGVAVHLRFGGPSLTLVVRDDGCGFDPSVGAAREDAHAHFGIQGMRERALLLGGELKIKSRIGRGTVVILQVPLPTGQVARPFVRATPPAGGHVGHAETRNEVVTP